MYPTDASDTFRVGDLGHKPSIIDAMKESWFVRAKRRMKAEEITQEALKSVFGVTTRGAVGHYLSGRRTPSPEQMSKLAKRLGMSLDELQDGTIPPIRAYSVREYTEDADLIQGREVLVDEVDVMLAAGDGVIVPEFVETKFQMPYQSSWFRKHHAKPQDVKLMRVHGDSMEPLVFDGDRVAVHLKDNQRIIDGKVYALIFGGDQFGRIKRLYSTRDGLRITSDNVDKERFPDEIITAADMEHVYIIGRVIDKSGSGGL